MMVNGTIWNTILSLTSNIVMWRILFGIRVNFIYALFHTYNTHRLGIVMEILNLLCYQYRMIQVMCFII